MKVAVLLINRDQWDHTRNCLDSIEKSEGVEVLPLLVDNDSRTPPPPWLSDHPGLRFKALRENTGFAGGNNRAFDLMEPGEAPYTFILNNDATVRPDTISKLLSFMEEHPACAIATPAVYFASQPDSVWSAGGAFVPRRMIFDQRRWPLRSSLPASPEPTVFSTGCATMTRTALYRSLGGFREEFFMYYEDADLSIRAIEAGGEIWLIPGAEVFHHVSVSAGGVLSPFAVYYTLRNRIALAKSLLGRRDFTVFCAYILSAAGAKTLIYPLRRKGGLVYWMWKAVFDGFSGRMGATFRRR